MEYRMVDHDMYGEEMIHEVNGMAKKGWKIIRILDPIKYKDPSDGMFIRIFYEREQEETKEVKFTLQRLQELISEIEDKHDLESKESNQGDYMNAKDGYNLLIERINQNCI